MYNVVYSVQIKDIFHGVSGRSKTPSTPCGALRVLLLKRPYGCFWGGLPAVFYPLDIPSRMGLAHVWLTQD
jgi:hypothetical protein